MSFPLGRPVLAMFLLAAVTGGAVLLRREPPRKELLVWTFSGEHERAYRPLVTQFERRTGVGTDLQLINITALNHALLSDFTNGMSGTGTPDVAEVEIGNAGKFFRPPLAEMGFEPIEPYLKRAKLEDKIIPSRLATWSKRGVAFGVPCDVHPVGIVYREDLFREAGVDLPAATTWPAFQEACLRFQDYWRLKGVKDRHALELSRAKPDELLMMLQQRGINAVDDFDRVYLADPKVAQTIAFYARCVAGGRRIGGESAGGEGPFTQDLQAGNLCAFLAADWRLDFVQQYGGEALRGKLRLMPLPRFDPTDAPTATYGGTMIAILKTSRHKDEAWRLIEKLCFSPEALAARRRGTHVLPPIPSAWDAPEYRAPDPYFGGQRIDEQLIELARQVPRRYAMPATTIAGHYLVQVLSKAIDYVEERGDAGMEQACQRWLDAAVGDLSERIRHLSFD
jgi:ABC-type glycerol-3-phosphate transport system substrate-binding protein